MGRSNKKYTNSEYVKKRTLELYSQLSQNENERKARTDIRDQIIELNYSFFGYIASHKYINNPSVTYEDKFQSALLAFLKIWWWYGWEERYRTDLSFSVFFTPRIGEMIERDLNEVKYSLKRTLRMEVGKQLGKSWTEIRYEDLSKVTLPPDKMNSLKAIFGAVYWADLSEHELYIEAPHTTKDMSYYINDKCDNIEDYLINEMVENEAPISDSQLRELSEELGIPYHEMVLSLNRAKERLYKRLKNEIDCQM